MERCLRCCKRTDDYYDLEGEPQGVICIDCVRDLVLMRMADEGKAIMKESLETRTLGLDEEFLQENAQSLIWPN